MSLFTKIRDAITAPIRIPIQLVTEPKKVLTEVKEFGDSVRSAAGPFIGILNDVNRALSPIFRVEVDAQAKIDVPQPFKFDFRIPQLPIPIPDQQDQRAQQFIGDLTGGFLSNLTTDSEQLRQSRRKLLLLAHILRKGHRVGNTDILSAYAKFTPKDNNSFLLESNRPLFQIEIDENRAPSRAFRLNFPESRLEHLKTQQDALGASLSSVPNADDNAKKLILKGQINTVKLTAAQTLSLQTASSPAGENKIVIRVKLLNPTILNAGSDGTLEIGILRQTAYIEDSLLTAEINVNFPINWEDREFSYAIIMTEEYRRPETPDQFFTVNKRNSGGDDLLQLLDRSIDAAKLSTPSSDISLQGFDKAIDLGVKTALAKSQIVALIEEMKEAFRDSGSSNDFDLRGRLISNIEHVGTVGLFRDIELTLNDEKGARPLAKANLLSPRDFLSCAIPTTETANPVALNLAGRYQDTGTDPTNLDINRLLYQLDYGLLDELETCESSLVLPEVENPTEKIFRINGNMQFRSKNLFA